MAKKNTMLIPTLIIAAILIISLTIVSIKPKEAFAFGITTLSVSQANIIQDNQLGKAWDIYIAALPSGEGIAVIPTDKVEEKSGSLPSSDITLNLKGSQSIHYLLTQKSELYDYNVGVGQRYSCLFVPEYCKKEYPNQLTCRVEKPSGSLTCTEYYIQKNSRGVFGDFKASTPSVVSDIDLTVTGGQPQQTTTTKLNTKYNKLGELRTYDGKLLGKITLIGDLGTSEFIPTALNYGAVNLGNGWYLVEEFQLTDYRTKQSNDFKELTDLTVKYQGTGFKMNLKQAMEKAISDYNIYYSQATSRVNYAASQGFTETKEGVILKVSTDRIYTIPTARLMLDVDWVGIKISKATALISSIKPKECTSGLNNGIVTVGVTNVGDFGSIETSLKCPSFNELTGAYKDDFNIGQVKFYSFYFDKSLSNKESEECTITTKTESAFGVETKTSTVTLTCNPSNICDAGQKTCVDIDKNGVRDVAVCNNQGTGFSLIESCKEGCAIDAKGVPYCAETPPPPPPDECGYWIEAGSFKIPDLLCQFTSWVDKLLTPLKIILMIVGGVFAFFFVENFVQKRKLVKDNKSAMIIGVVAGLAFATLVWFYFYWGLAALIVLLLIKYATGGLI